MVTLPRLIAHRGGGAVAPENTCAAFRRAKADGALWVECDTRLSADGVPVIFHDPQLERTTNGVGLLADQPAAALCRLDAGSWFGPSDSPDDFSGERVPTLAATLSLFATLGLGVNLELKSGPGPGPGLGPYPEADPEAARRIASAAAQVVAEQAERCAIPILFSSFSTAALATLQDCAPDMARGLLVMDLEGTWERDADRLGCLTIHPNHQAIRTRSDIQRISAGGRLAVPYTVNDPARAATLLAWGATSIITDDPGRLRTSCPEIIGPEIGPEISASPPDRANSRAESPGLRR